MDHFSKNSELSSIQQVFSLNIKAECYRLQAEYGEFESRENNIQNALDLFINATNLAENSLEPAEVVRLEAFYSYGLFLYEVLEQRMSAIIKIKQSFDDAIGDIYQFTPNLDELQKSMQKIRDKLTMWSNEMNDELS